uniref:Succinate dehydrogenase [ubiquinone] cytochrome b small subunit n=1 Tax=Anopheles triannulatus TaxID=58253 RepID=A0A2M4AHU1_9DIPT
MALARFIAAGKGGNPHMLLSSFPTTLAKSPVYSPNVRRFALSASRNSSAGNHVTLWNAERVVSAALLGVVPFGIMFPSFTGDTLIAVSVVMHQHWGLEAIVTDYVRPILFGTTVPKLAHGLLLIVSAATLGGLFYFNYNDVGIAGCVKKIWATKSKE